jgi:putative ABC transport system permease protein
MLRNYFKIAYRNLLKNKMFSLINITGLSVGIMSSFMILIYVGYEFSYDRFHKNAEQLYRVNFTFQAEGTAAVVQPSLGPAVKAALPEVEDYIRIYTLNNNVLQWNDQALRIEQLFCTDASFLEHFSLHWLKGNRQQALSSAQSVVLSSSTAKQLFGNENPIGQTIWRNRDISYTVTGVFEDFPQNAHFHPDVLFSYEMLYDGDYPAWFKAEGRMGLCRLSHLSAAG